MKTFSKGIAIISILTFMLSLSSCDNGPDVNSTGKQSHNTPEPHINTDPRKDWVQVWSTEGSTTKRCDKNNLIYRTSFFNGHATAMTIAVSPNDPQCLVTHHH